MHQKNTAFLLFIWKKCKIKQGQTRQQLKHVWIFLRPFVACILSVPVNSSFSITLLSRKSVKCVLINYFSNCFGDWINEEPNCCVTNGFHLISMTHFWLCCLFISRHANCQKVLLGMQTHIVANASTVRITVYTQHFSPLLLCPIWV